MRARAKSLLAVSILGPFLLSTVAHGYSTDVFSRPSPLPDNKATSGAKNAPEQVDPSGAAIYSIPIPTAPNRGGMVPDLALTYSSRNPIRGGVAMGWSLSIPHIEVDTSQGRLSETRYRSSIGGHLIRARDSVEPGWIAYRGEEDSSYTRYERDGTDGPVQMWRARLSDGRVMYFGEAQTARDSWNARAVAVTNRWFVTRIVDRFGNEIHFTYHKVSTLAPEGTDTIPVDITLDSVEYGFNAAAGLPNHARIEFEYASNLDQCDGSNVPIGAQFDFSSGIPLYLGAQRLTGAVLKVASNGNFTERHRLALDYDMSELTCGRTGVSHAPLRILTAVRETAVAPGGTTTTLPPTTFTYNRRERTFDRTRTVDSTLLSAGLRKTGAHSGFGRDTTTRTLLDLDGDGRVDRLTLDDEAVDSGYCTAHYSPNLGGTFGAALPFGIAAVDRSYRVLPTLPWKGAARDSANEYCSLTHQVSRPVNYPDWDPGDAQVCDQVGPAAPGRPNEAETHHGYRFLDLDGDGRPELVSAIEAFPLAYRPELDARLSAQLACTESECADFGTWMAGVGCVTTPGNDQESCRPQNLTAERPCGRYVYRVHKNLGGGAFAPATAVSAPVPLDPKQEPDDLVYSTLVDLDGDGRLDAVRYIYQIAEDPFASTPDPQQRYLVWRGLANGFEQQPHVWQLPLLWQPPPGSGSGQVQAPPAMSSGGVIMEPGHWDHCDPHGPPDEDCDQIPIGRRQKTEVSLEDINGDGLPDYVDSRGSGIRVFYNAGAQFETYDAVAPGDRGTSLIPDDPDQSLWGLWSVDVQDRQFYGATESLGGPTTRVMRLTDLDADGLSDLIVTVSPGHPLEETRNETDLYVNRQDRFINVGASAHLSTVAAALSTGAHIGNERPNGAMWNEGGDFVDLDGDGLPEAILGTTARSDSDDQPLRLLKHVDNGRGLTLDYRYRAISGQGVPQPMWVVSDVTASPGPDADGAPTPASTTSYAYEGSAFNQDFDGKWGFRGFATTTVTQPSGARTVTVRSFDQYYGGLATEERVEDRQLDASTYHAATITRMTYTTDIIPAGGEDEEGEVAPDPTVPGPQVVTHHARTKTTRTCGAQQTPAQCNADGALETETYTWIAAPTSHPAMYVQQSTWVGTQLALHPGMRINSQSTDVITEASRYQALVEEESKWLVDDQLASQLIGHTLHGYDTSQRVELTSSRQIDDDQYAITTYTYDLTTGNQLTEQSPGQHGSSLATTFGYDPTATFVASTINALGHEVQTHYDAATGALVEQRGPNVKTVNGSPVRNGFTHVIDGLGRVLSESVTVDDAALGYRLVPTVRATYVDGPRTLVTHEKRVELDEDRWARTDIEQDGLGRDIVTRTYSGTTLMTLARNYYDTAGNLVRASVPHPNYNAVAWVDWKFVYDSLGRLLKQVEPTRSGCAADPAGAAFCGQSWTYDGLTSVRTDRVGTIGGAVGTTTTTNDVFGRMVRVDEATTTATPATTTYAYDGNDHVRKVVSADGVVTIMEHDYLGHRTGITRGTRTWRYGYDAEGNVISIVAPTPANADPALYTTTITYDPLDRETSRIVGARDLTNEDIARFGDGMIVHSYDTGVNALGLLSGTSQYLGGSDFQSSTLGYDARGHVTRDTRSFSILGGQFSDERTATRTYSAQGLVREVTAADGASAAASTKFRTFLDDRGLPWLVYDPNRPDWIEAVWRNYAGRVTTTYFYKTHGTAMVSAGSTVFDVLGRVTSFQASSALPGQTTQSARASESFVFNGAGDVASMQSGLWPDTATSAPASWTFGYDPQHQLTSASGAMGYQGSFGYTPGGKVASVTVTAGPVAVRVHPRAVTYSYGDGTAADRDAPTVLNGASAPWMSIAYDSAGNATTRNIAGASYSLRYDGADLQREAGAPDGSLERSWYGPDRMRSLTAELEPSGAVHRIRWNFGEAEIWYRGDGTIEREAASTSIDGTVARFVNHTRREMLYSEPRGHMLAAIDEDGHLLAGFHYGPWGEILEQAGLEQDAYRKRFNGKDWSPTSGLTDYGYRQYDEYTLSWTQADPMYRFRPDRAGATPQRANLYTFTKNNPISLIDPDGLSFMNFVKHTLAAGLGAAAIVAGGAACVTTAGLACAAGAVVATLGADVMYTNIVAGSGPDQPTAVGRAGGATAQNLEVGIVGGVAVGSAVLSAARAVVASGAGATVTVTSWASQGKVPDLNPGRWVQLGNATRANFLMTGLQGGKFWIKPGFPIPSIAYAASNVPFSNSITGNVPAASLAWPPGFEVIKGLLGQRVIQ